MFVSFETLNKHPARGFWADLIHHAVALCGEDWSDEFPGTSDLVTAAVWPDQLKCGSHSIICPRDWVEMSRNSSVESTSNWKLGLEDVGISCFSMVFKFARCSK